MHIRCFLSRTAFLLGLLLSVPAMAGLNEGLSYFDTQQYPKAFTEFKPLADRGDQVAQYYLAYLYLNGYGVDRDADTGISYLKKSADQGYEKALSLMGYYLFEGQNVRQDKNQAVKFYTQAAEKGDNDALLNLGVLYYIGDGVEKDYDMALDYFKKVDMIDKPIVGRYIGDIYQFSKDEKQRAETRTFYKLAAASGDLPAFHTLAYLDQTGFEKEKDLKRAIQYYVYAASQNYAPSQYALGILYANGEGVERNIASAHAWFSLAATQGLPIAIETQKRLEKNMTLTDLDASRRAVVEIQKSIIGKQENPLKSLYASGPLAPGEDGMNVKKPISRRRRRR